MEAAGDKNLTLTLIKFGYNDIGPKGTASLAAALQGNTTMTSFDLSANTIRAEGAVSLAAALDKNCALNFDELREQIDQFLARNIARYPQWRNSVMGWMWASKNLHVRLTRDVALMIGQMIWKTWTIYESASIGGNTQASSRGPSKGACVQDEDLL